MIERWNEATTNVLDRVANNFVGSKSSKNITPDLGKELFSAKENEDLRPALGHCLSDA